MFGFGKKDNNEKSDKDKPSCGHDHSKKTHVEIARETIAKELGEGNFQDISVVNNGLKVVFNLLMDNPSDPKRQELIKNLEIKLKEKGFEELDVYTTKKPESSNAQAPESSQGHRPIGGTAARGQLTPKSPIPGIKYIIAINSGKGGVGKSTCAVNIAVALAKLGNIFGSSASPKIGLLDADITGPNTHLMLGISGQPTINEDKKINPQEAYGVKLISMGTLVADDKPTLWRGPMLDGVIKQFLREVDWGELDFLVIDLPPGTSDAQLTLAQNVPLSGVVTITTPQDVALLDAKKGYMIFNKMHVPMLGLIENMSYFTCPHCEERSEIFSHGGGKKTAQELGLDFLGEIPIELKIRTGGDSGKPIVAEDINHPVSKAFLEIAKKIVTKVESLKSQVV